MRDSFVFYRSFADAFRDLDPETFKTAVVALWNYALDDDPKTDDVIANSLLKLAMPLIDRNNVNYENGKKGGRPKTANKPIENRTETEVEPIDNRGETEVELTETEANPNDKCKMINDKRETESHDSEKRKPMKHRHGERVLLTDDEYERLKSDYGEEKTEEAIQYLNDYIAEKQYKSKSHNLALRRWVFDAVEEQNQRRGKLNKPRSGTSERPINRFNDFEQRDYDDDDLERQLLEIQMGTPKFVAGG